MNRLTAADYNTGQYFHYTYDAVGNRLQENRLVHTQTPEVVNTYAYDDANRLTGVNGVSYTWDANGNLLADGTSIYSYDHANRLVGVTQGSDVYNFAYLGSGDRIGQTVNGVTTTYALDLNAGLTQVLSDGANTYLYGNGRIAQMNGVDSAYFLVDALGSVRQLADASGAVTLTKGYEPYGEVLYSQGSGASSYGYTGEWLDETGFTFLRSRYYSGVTGRFISQDTWSGDNKIPLSYNLWLYAYGNPIMSIDPSGQIPVCDNVPCPHPDPILPFDPNCESDGRSSSQDLQFLGATSPYVYDTYRVLRDDVRWWGNNYYLRSMDHIDYLRLILAHEFSGVAKNIETKVLAETIVRNFYYICSEYGRFGMTCEWGTLKNTIIYIAAKTLLTHPGRNMLISRSGSQLQKESEVKQKWAYYSDQNLSAFAQYFRYPLPEWKSGGNDPMAPVDWGNASMFPNNKKVLARARLGTHYDEIYSKEGSGDFFVIATIPQIDWWKYGKTP